MRLFGKGREGRMIEGYVPVATYMTKVEAELSQAALAAAGIESYLKDEDAGGMLPFLQQTEGVQLLVEPKDLEEATLVLSKQGTDEGDQFQ